MSSTIQGCEITARPVTLEVTIRAIPRGRTKYVLRYSNTHIIDTRHIMTNPANVGSISVGHHARISEVYGAYSSHEVHVTVNVPASREEIAENMEGIVEEFQHRCVVANRDIFNRVLQSVGKDPLFHTEQLTEGADEGA